MTSDEIDAFVQELKSAICDLGVKDGDNLLVHSSLAQLIYVTKIFDGARAAAMLHECFRQAVGRSGVIAVLAATWETAKHRLDYDGDSTPVSKDLGLFPEYLRILPSSHRTNHPVFSLCFEGEDVPERYIRNEHKYAFGVASPWHTMISDDFKIVFFGLSTLKQMSLVHHVEHNLGVPYCYNKIFLGGVSNRGAAVEGMHVYNVPYRNVGIEYSTMDAIKMTLCEKGILKEGHLSGIPVMVSKMKETYDVLLDALSHDPYCLLKKKPLYSENLPPVDVY
jgi:aminoglycoside 3-N-acetyltransferase